MAEHSPGGNGNGAERVGITEPCTHRCLCTPRPEAAAREPDGNRLHREARRGDLDVFAARQAYGCFPEANPRQNVKFRFDQVGHMGRSSKGTETGPTLSGGIGRSGAQREYGSPAKEDDAATISNNDKERNKTVLKDLSPYLNQNNNECKRRSIEIRIESYHPALLAVKE